MQVINYYAIIREGYTSERLSRVKAMPLKHVSPNVMYCDIVNVLY